MDQDKINEMADAIFSAGDLRDRGQIIAALNLYWTGKMVIVWDRSDIFGKAWARGRLLTNEQADDLLDDLRRHHDPELGVTWTTIECALDEVEPLDIEKLNLASLVEVDYPGDFRVWWNDDEATRIFNTDAGHNLLHALTFAAIQATEVKGEVQVCIVDEAGNNYSIAYYEVVDGKLVIENASEDCDEGVVAS